MRSVWHAGGEGLHQPPARHDDSQRGHLRDRLQHMGPSGRYGAVMFLEKEGFTQILEAAKIAERYDIAIMSTKGMSVTAARMLVEELCGRRGLPLFVLHDFDIAGFSIKKTLTESGERFQFKHKSTSSTSACASPMWRSLGFRGSVQLPRQDERLSRSAAINGATPEEIDFLTRWRAGRTQRHAVRPIRRLRRAQAHRARRR